ncbi:MAG: polysulfide reductase NrfD [Betaproteobacteria bacterium]|nr:polysulfide reductase NrfD [Betaproteobacteria bacterium]
MHKLARFAWDYVSYIVKGGPKFYAWMGSLGVLIAIWAYCFYVQATEGLAVTGLTDQVSDGLYLGNVMFLVGVAAAAVTVVFPAYVYHHKALHEVTVLGEMVAIAAVTMCNLFVLSHMGRPDRLWHMLPVIGIYNIPNSMITFDVLVLQVYLMLNVACGFYFLYMKYTGGRINKILYMPLVYLSIVWALSIHSVTALFVNTMPARPFWHQPIMPIHFISTAFAAGPALIILIFLIIRRNTKLWIADEAINLLSTIVTYCLGIALFLLMSEVATELYHPTEHTLGREYLMFGVHGLNALVPWFWASLIANIVAFVMLLIPRVRKNYRFLPVACVLAFAGIWVQKGVALLVPGFIPSPIGEFTNYVPTLLEVLVSLGNWAIGAAILTVLIKGAIGVLLGEVKYASAPWEVSGNVMPFYRASPEPTTMQPWAPLTSPGVRSSAETTAGGRTRRAGRGGALA